MIEYVGSLNKDNYILDTSIGRGGDLNKYSNEDLNTKFIFGLDLYPVNEACKRMYYNNPNKIPTVIIRYDTSKDIESKQGITGTDQEQLHSNTMIDILYNNINYVPKEYKKILPKFKNMANNKFNIISSQFSIHYYFENMSMLESYLENISNNCKSGGYFIGTCYDGSKVFNLLNRINKLEYIDELNNVVYYIEKDYTIDNFDYNPKDTSNMLGKKIKVYMDSIGKEITEYLVNFDFMIDIMTKYGFHLLSNKTNNVLEDSLNSFELILNKLPKIKDDKLNTNILSILDNEPLMNLSKLNNYFIFQKK